MTRIRIAFAVPAVVALLISIGLGIWGDACPAGSGAQHMLFTYASLTGMAAVAIGIAGTIIVRSRVRRARDDGGG